MCAETTTGLQALRARSWSRVAAGSILGCGISMIAGACSSARVGASETGTPSLILPARFAEGSGDDDATDGGAAVTGAVASPGAGDAGQGTNPPDPEPRSTRVHWDHALHYDKGEVTVERVTRVELGQPAPSPRRMGRFAIELWIGQELVDRVRFDFPLLAADVAEGRKRPLHDSPRFAPGADTRATVRVPDSDRATRAVLVDRQTGRVVPLPWPPAPPAGSSAPPSVSPPARSGASSPAPPPAPSTLPPR